MSTGLLSLFRHKGSRRNTTDRKGLIRGTQALSVPSRRLAAHVFSIALVLGVGALVFAQTRSYGLLGMDNYPIILTSRVLSWADLWGNLTERLMDGFYPAAFYRPLLNLSFAVDYALWGLAAPGYQLSNVLCFAACALSLYAFLATRPVPRAPGYALAGVIFFLFQPLLFEVLPFPPRRPELLCLTFMLLALASEARSGWRFRTLGGVAALLALAAKETAIILPGLVFLWTLAYARGDLRRRVLAAGGRALISVVPVALYLAARFEVLGGMGGRGPIDFGKALEVFPKTLGTLLLRVSSPSSPESWTLAGVWLLLSIGLLVAAGKRFSSDPGDRRQRWAPVADLLFAAGWLVLLAAIYTLSKRLSPWYVVAAVIGFSVALSAICEGYGSWLRRDSPILRVAGLAILAAVGVLVSTSQLRWSPALRPYALWRLTTAADDLLVKTFEDTLLEAEVGSVTRLMAGRKKIKGAEGAALFRGAVLQTDYSLQAWAELVHPEREVRVLKSRHPLKREPLKPSEVVIILDRRPRPKQLPSKTSQSRAEPAGGHRAVDGDGR